MTQTLRACLVIALLGLGACGERSAPARKVSPSGALTVKWDSLPNLPLATAGAFSGMSNGALVVAGGAYFPGKPSYEGGSKAWVDSVFVLPSREEVWQRVESLSEPRAYGAAVDGSGGMILIGGSNSERYSDEVIRLRWKGKQLKRTMLPSLPQSLAMTSAALIDSVVYVAGGQTEPRSGRALHNFWALDLKSEDTAWQELEPWPGPARILPVVAAQDSAVYVISGAELVEGEDGGTTRRFLSDAYRYRLGEGWKQVADVPQPVVAAPAAPHGERYVVVFGGDSGEHFLRQDELKDRHPGFRRGVLAFDVQEGTWNAIGELPVSLVTTNAVPYKEGIVIPGGEDRPSHRSPVVLHAQLRK